MIRNLNLHPKVYKFSLSTACTGAKASSSIWEYFLSVTVKVRLIHWIIFVSCELFGLLWVNTAYIPAGQASEVTCVSQVVSKYPIVLINDSLIWVKMFWCSSFHNHFTSLGVNFHNGSVNVDKSFIHRDAYTTKPKNLWSSEALLRFLNSFNAFVLVLFKETPFAVKWSPKKVTSDWLKRHFLLFVDC